jgi:predicted acylesterase/phospholipase RssA
MELNEVHARRAKLGLADLLIAPPIAGFSLLEFESYERIIDAGYRAAREALKAWSYSPAHEKESIEGGLVRT